MVLKTDLFARTEDTGHYSGGDRRQEKDLMDLINREDGINEGMRSGRG